MAGYLCAGAGDRADEEPRAHPHLLHRPAPATVAAAIAALDLIAPDPALAAVPLAKARALTPPAGLPPAASPSVPLIVGAPEAALAAARFLEAEGFLVVPIRPPTVPAGTARLRFAFTARHDDADIERLADLVRTRVAIAA
jgi:8-amino-7-oxononanoate synthase